MTRIHKKILSVGGTKIMNLYQEVLIKRRNNFVLIITYCHNNIHFLNSCLNFKFLSNYYFHGCSLYGSLLGPFGIDTGVPCVFFLVQRILNKISMAKTLASAISITRRYQALTQKSLRILPFTFYTPKG